MMCTKLNVRGAKCEFWAVEESKPNLAFQTTYGLFEPTVMEFGSTNATAAFQLYNHIAI